MDKIIGDPGQFSKYALICEFCSSHNGLVPPEMFSSQNFRCYRCDKFNFSQEAKLKNLSQKFMEKESPLRNFSGSNASNAPNLSDLSNGSITPKEKLPKQEYASSVDDGGKENESTKENEARERESRKENGTVTPPNGGSDVEKKKSSSKLKRRTNKKSN